MGNTMAGYIINTNRHKCKYSRHRLISPPLVNHFWAYYPAEFYVVSFNEMFREKLETGLIKRLVLLSGGLLADVYLYRKKNN